MDTTIYKGQDGSIFSCTCKSDRYGFTHVVTWLTPSGSQYEGRARWVNRTWETYTYETAIYNAIEKRAARLFEELLDNYKDFFRVQRMTRKQKAAFCDWVKRHFAIDNPRLYHGANAYYTGLLESLTETCNAMTAARARSYEFKRGGEIPTTPLDLLYNALGYDYMSAYEDYKRSQASKNEGGR